MLHRSALLDLASDCYFTTFVLCYLELGSNVRKQRLPFHTHDWFPSLWSRTGHFRVNPLINMWGCSTGPKSRDATNKLTLFMIQQSSKRDAQSIRQARCGSAWATLTRIHLITAPMGPPGYPSMSGHILPPNFRWSRYLTLTSIGSVWCNEHTASIDTFDTAKTYMNLICAQLEFGSYSSSYCSIDGLGMAGEHIAELQGSTASVVHRWDFASGASRAGTPPALRQ